MDVVMYNQVQEFVCDMIRISKMLELESLALFHCMYRDDQSLVTAALSKAGRAWIWQERSMANDQKQQKDFGSQ